jgi:hypothetical protein
MMSARFLAGVVAVLPRRTLFVLPGLLLPASVASASVPSLAFMARRDGIPFGTPGSFATSAATSNAGAMGV